MKEIGRVVTMSAKPSIPVSRLECSKAFEALTSDERHYAHYLAQASFQGSLIVLLQTSPESPFIFLLLEKIFSEESVESLRAECTKESAGVSNEEFDVGFLCNEKYVYTMSCT